jgi:WD40 repeat protein
MCFSPGDELLAAGDESGHVMVWEAGTGKRYLRLATAEGVAVSSLAFGCDGSSLLVNTRGGGIESIDLVTDHWLSFAACAANRTLTPIERALYIDSTFSDSN